MADFIQLTDDEKRILESVYGRQFFAGSGYNPNKLEAIRALSAQENKFFAGKNFVSPHFYVQTLYKVRGTVSPMKFNAAVNRTLTENENLRANFCTVGTRTVKGIRSQNVVRPAIVFRNLTETDPDELNEILSRLMDADMRREFDLKHDPLIRFSVFKTSEIDFAVLVTRAQLIADSFDAEKFFATVTDNVDKLNPKVPAASQPTVFDRAAVRDYWAKVLDNAPPLAKLPFERNAAGAYKQKVFRAKVPVDILSDLRGRAQSNRLMLTAILQSAWGFMLQAGNKRKDCLFCQILSANKRDEKFSLNMIPVRLIADDNLTVEKIVTNQFRQLVVSQPYSRVDWDDLQELSSGKLFDHFLSFRDFRADELDYVGAKAEPSGHVVAQNSWDAQGMKLGAYFRYSERNLSMTFLYDEKCFIAGGVEKLCELFNLILKQMLVDWNVRFSAFADNFKRRMEMLLQAETAPTEDAQKTIRHFLSQLPILQGRYEGTIDLFAEQSALETFYEGDRISGDMLAQKFIFVVDGKLVRSVDTGDGWYNPLDVVRRNAFINPTSFLDKPKLSLSAEVLTDQAQLLMIPRAVLLDAFNSRPELARALMQYALTQMERYQMLWLQS